MADVYLQLKAQQVNSVKGFVGVSVNAHRGVIVPSWPARDNRQIARAISNTNQDTLSTRDRYEGQTQWHMKY